MCAVFLAGPALAGCAADIEDADDPVASQAEALSAHCADAVPEILAVPKGNRPAFRLDAEGVQIYQCQTAASGAEAWVFKAPEADLMKKNGRLAGTHYAGPTWESIDGSTVVATKLTDFPAHAGAIPWLLLKAAAHTGDGRMSQVTFIQRLDTAGGLAPSAGCDAEHLGDTARVDYTATYFFFEKSRAKHSKR